MIQLAYPVALLSLLAIPLLIALHLLRPRRRRVVLSTTTLWQAALKDRERGLGLRRLLRNLSLLLLLASALVLGLALAGPQWLTRASEGADTVLVLDVSASMKTRSGIGTTRFDQALAEAADIVDGLPREGRMLVMTSGRKALLRTGFEADRDALRRVLAQLRPGDEAGRPREALALALSLLRGREQGRIYFLTDGAFDPDVDPGSPQVVFRVVGAPARNVAITRFDFRQELASDDRFQVLMTVRNYTDAPVVVPASVSLDGRALYRGSLELEASNEQTLVLPFRGRALGRAVGRIDVDDDLAADNQAFAAVNAGDPLRVLLFTRGNFYLESVLEALPDLDLIKREWSPAEDIARLARIHDVVVFDGIAGPRLPPGNFLLVNTVAPGLPFSDAGRVAQPDVVGRGPSALMRDVDLTAVHIDRALRVVIDEPVPGLQRLFWSPETDLALALLDDGLKLVYLGFDLAQSNFPLQAAFPLFFSQSLEWLRPRGDGFVSTHIAAGSTHSIRVPSIQTRVIMRMPSGDATTLEVKGGSLLFDATADTGIYRYSVGEVARYFAVTLTDARESDVNSRWAPGERREQLQPAGNGAQALVPLWPHLLVLALVLLALEWCVWTGSRGSA
ncbi:MAG: VWA domain-containing protein [Betaproteobacteria bacterium]|nr:VWA domain-containing protein [Betaproteobacteria bacterium]MDH3437714.1 VWA domain-containing protein [Betaproteobacteria bacterium]